MLGPGHPRSWLRYMYNFAKHYRIMGHGMIRDIILKTFSFLEGSPNHHVRPSSPFVTEMKFTSPKMREMYIYMKFLKKALDVDISSFWMKQELQHPQYESILDMSENDRALVQLISMPGFRSRFEGKIDLQKSLKMGHVILKK